MIGLGLTSSLMAFSLNSCGGSDTSAPAESTDHVAADDPSETEESGDSTATSSDEVADAPNTDESGNDESGNAEPAEADPAEDPDLSDVPAVGATDDATDPAAPEPAVDGANERAEADAGVPNNRGARDEGDDAGARSQGARDNPSPAASDAGAEATPGPDLPEALEELTCETDDDCLGACGNSATSCTCEPLRGGGGGGGGGVTVCRSACQTDDDCGGTGGQCTNGLCSIDIQSLFEGDGGLLGRDIPVGDVDGGFGGRGGGQGGPGGN
jgi:hypothetical protein